MALPRSARSLRAAGRTTGLLRHGVGQTQLDVRLPGFSSDGRWLAYADGSPRALWVRPFPDVSTTRHFVASGLSPGGAFGSRTGRELLYQQGDRWWSVTVRGERPDAPFELGRPVAIPVPARVVGLYAAWSDGRRLLALRSEEAFEPEACVIVNFFEELRAKLPVKR